MYGLQARGITEPCAEPRTLAEMAADYLQQIQAIQPAGPYHLLGYSLGGNVAHEIAIQLQDQGEETALLAMLDAYPQVPNQATAPTEHDQLAFILILAGCPAPATDGAILTRAGVIESLRHSDNPIATELDDEQLSALIENYVNNMQLMDSLAPRVYKGDVMHFAATRNRTETTPATEIWKPHVLGVIDTYEIDCIHIGMTEPVPLAYVGELLGARLRTRL